MQVKYVGPSPEVDVIVPGGSVRVAHGQTVEVPDEVGGSLLEQGTFSAVKATKKEQD